MFEKKISFSVVLHQNVFFNFFAEHFGELEGYAIFSFSVCGLDRFFFSYLITFSLSRRMKLPSPIGHDQIKKTASRRESFFDTYKTLYFVQPIYFILFYV